MPYFLNLRFFLICSVFSLLLFACNQNGQSNEVSKANRVAYEFIVENDGFVDSLINHFRDIPVEQFKWKNHLVLFGHVNRVAEMDLKMKQLEIPVKIKRYRMPLYVFDKASHCEATNMKTPWKNYLLTANLVEDTVLQQEYVEHHKTQFKKWPEVAEGFCNADFQQLLVYRNGRQLLLVISIPANKTLDELNPKTVENNPKMDEWNAMMSKYQEGIKGTSEDEVWVFLDKVELN